MSDFVEDAKLHFLIHGSVTIETDAAGARIVEGVEMDSPSVKDLLIVLGWGLDDFEDALPRASVETLNECRMILERPPRDTFMRDRAGIYMIQLELMKRGVPWLKLGDLIRVRQNGTERAAYVVFAEPLQVHLWNNGEKQWAMGPKSGFGCPVANVIGPLNPVDKRAQSIDALRLLRLAQEPPRDRGPQLAAALNDALMPELIRLLEEQLLRYHKAAITVLLDEKEPPWLRALDIAQGQLNRQVEAAYNAIADRFRKAGA